MRLAQTSSLESPHCDHLEVLPPGPDPEINTGDPPADSWFRQWVHYEHCFFDLSSPRSERELLAVYGALLAHGTELDAAGIAAMTPGLEADTIGSFMHLFDDSKVLRRANSGVVDFMRQHPIVELWGDGTLMSSDSMSLEATRHLWKARVDPKHRRYAVGMYTHVLNQWGII